MTGLMLLGCDSDPGWKDDHGVDIATGLKGYPALFAVDRNAMGFPPLPAKGVVRILTVDNEHWPQGRPPEKYDVMFQFFETESKDFHYTERDVTLKKVDGMLKWNTEQMSFHGPKTFLDDEESQTAEMIVIRNNAEDDAYFRKPPGTRFIYTGSDKKLGGKGGFGVDITREQAGQTLRGWGYHYEADRTAKK